MTDQLMMTTYMLRPMRSDEEEDMRGREGWTHTSRAAGLRVFFYKFGRTHRFEWSPSFRERMRWALGRGR